MTVGDAPVHATLSQRDFASCMETSMPEIDLRKLLSRSLVANSNQPVHIDGADAPAVDTQPPPQAPSASPRDSPRMRRDGARQAPAPSAQRTHRALRPRRRT